METDLLVLVAHPDDEVYGVGGTLLQFKAAGLRTALITLTRGGSGRNLGLCKPEETRDFREQELRQSVEILGIHDFVLFDYPDAAPTQRSSEGATSNPSSFVGGLQNEDVEAITSRVALELTRLKPKRIVTFAPDGSNRHPDHVAANRITLGAINKSEVAPVLYYFARQSPGREEWRDTWRPPSHARPAHDVLVEKLRAIACHRSQALSTVDIFKGGADRIVTELFRRAEPDWHQGPLEFDL